MKFILLISLISVQAFAGSVIERTEDCYQEYIGRLENPQLREPVTQLLFPPKEASEAVSPSCDPVIHQSVVEELAANALKLAGQVGEAGAALYNAGLIRKICEARQHPLAAPLTPPLDIHIGGPTPVRIDKGRIDDALARIRNHIRANQFSRVEININLNSDGGQLTYAEKFVEEVRKLSKNPLVTIRTQVKTGKNCGSACTVMFLAGEERLAAKGTRFGFHQVGSEKLRESDPRVKAEMDRLREYWIKSISELLVDDGDRSTDEEKVRQALRRYITKIPQEEFRYISEAQLRGYVTGNLP